jgi:hypothetical protein
MVHFHFADGAIATKNSSFYESVYGRAWQECLLKDLEGLGFGKTLQFHINETEGDRFFDSNGELQ